MSVKYNKFSNKLTLVICAPSQKFKKDPSAESHFPANGQGSISGVIVDADDETGLANNIFQIIFGGNLKQRF